jgi:hypothetical protein
LIRDGHVLRIDARKDRAMKERAFDELLRSFASGLSRRATLATLTSGIFGAGSLALWDDAAAKKKRRRKKKRKKCKGGAKKCGKKCIAATACCSSADCGNGACVGNTCNCDSGFKECNGACIAHDECCGTCPGDKECVGGDCVCPASAAIECPGDACFSDIDCCDAEGCFAGFECVDHRCLCPGAGDINCAEVCCDGATEVCKVELIDGEVIRSCPAGGCPATNFCSDFGTEQFICANDPARVCVCTSTVDLIPIKVCVDFFSLGDESCQECDTSSDCGTGRVCVADGPGCECGVNFCVEVCPEVASNSARHGTGGTPVDLEALTGRMRKRHR